MTDREIIERLKDVADELDAVQVTATRYPGPDTWRTYKVRHASLFNDTSDGWESEVPECVL